MADPTQEAGARFWAERVAYGERLEKFRPPPAPPSRGRQDLDAEAVTATWLWAIAQSMVGLDRKHVEQFAERFDLRVLERPVSPNLMIYGEAYSAPGSIAVEYDDWNWQAAEGKPLGVVVRVAVEGVWPNHDERM